MEACHLTKGDVIMNLHNQSNLKSCSSRKPSMTRRIIWTKHSLKRERGVCSRHVKGKYNLSYLPFSGDTGNNSVWGFREVGVLPGAYSPFTVCS